MAYTGEVRVGGPADTREVDGLVITKLAVGPYDNNAYLLRCSRSGDLLLVDAANEASRLLDEVARQGGRLVRVVTTHQHADHWQALAEVVHATGARVAVHRLDAGPLPVPADELLEDGGEVTVGAARLRVVHLVGHTPGSVALVYDAAGALAEAPHVFTGDALFPGGVGNTWNDPERFASLIDGVESKIFGPLPDATWVYPGHGRDTTLGAERPHLGEWRERGW